MKRLIKKSSALNDIDLSGYTVNVYVNEELDDKFAKKVETAYQLMEIVDSVKSIFKEKNIDSNFETLENYLGDLNELDSSLFDDIFYCQSSLKKFIKLYSKQSNLWDEYQSLNQDYKERKKEGKDVSNLIESMEELRNKIHSDKDEVDIENSKVQFNQFYVRINASNIKSLYNKENSYYALEFKEDLAYSTDLSIFSDFCKDVSNQPKEIQMSRKTYFREYLLKYLIGEGPASEYLDHLDNYLNSSNKSSLETISNITLNNPDLIEVNKIVSSNIDTVYRGMNFETKEDIEYEAILNGNMNINSYLRFASTTTIKSVAENFAKSGKAGLLLVIKPGTIIYNSDLAGGVFGEGEIIVDMQDSQIIEVIEMS